MKDWAPLIGSSIIALATLLTLAFTVRQNNKSLRLAAGQHTEALEASRQRDFDGWLRSVLIENAASVMDQSKVILSFAASVMDEEVDQGRVPFYERYNDAIAVLAHDLQRLRMLAPQSVYGAAKALHAKHHEARQQALRWDRFGERGDTESETFARQQAEITDALLNSHGVLLIAERKFADAVRAAIGTDTTAHKRPTDQTDSPHSTPTAPTDPAAPPAPDPPSQDA